MLDHSSQETSSNWSSTFIIPSAPIVAPGLPEVSLEPVVRPSSGLAYGALVLVLGGALLLIFAALSGVLLSRMKAASPSKAEAVGWVPPRWLVGPGLRLRRSLMWLADRMVPAELPLFERSVGIVRTELMRVAAKLKIADMVADGPLSVEVLAARTHSDANALSRVLRGLVAIGVFSLRRGLIHNNRLSLALRTKTPRSVRDFAHYFGSASNVLAWAHLDQTVSTGASAFAAVHGVDVWSWFDQHPQERQLFAGAMTSMTQMEAPILAASSCFDGLSRVCDVAGSEGILLEAVMKRRPQMSGVLFEREGFVPVAERFLRGKGLSERAQVIGGDFFQGVPAGCDGYIMKNVLHDFTDPDALLVLKACRQSMAPGARLFIIEMLAEAAQHNEVVAVSDLQMMTICKGGRQRSSKEFEAILQEAGFRFRKAHTTATLSCIVEGEAI